MNNIQSSQSHVSENSLYHYTSQTGFKGIVESKTIWATNILYLNDSAEFIHAVNTTRNGFDAIYDEVSVSKQEKPFLEKIYEHLNEFETNRGIGIFVSSFSRNKDKLSQWRGYCPNGDGYCVRFDFNQEVLNRVRRNGFELVECVYADDDDSPNLVLEFLESALKVFRETYNDKEIPNNKIEVAFEKFGFEKEFLKIATRLKHIAFKEEEEWRLVSAPMWLNESQVKYRPGKSMLIPYVEICLKDDDNLLNIPEVWVGPTPHPNLAQNSAYNFLISNEVYAYKNQIKESFPSWDDDDDDYGDQRDYPRVHKSKAPYRIW